jgi:peroxiredoxin
MKTSVLARLFALPVVLVWLSVMSYAGGWNYRIGETAPAFKLTSLDGKSVSLEDYQGRIVVMSFLNSWCPFSNAAAPSFDRIGKQYHEQGVETLIVGVREDKGAISEFVRKHNLSCPVVLDSDGKIAERYAPPPTFAPDMMRDAVMVASFLIIDKQGEIQFLSLNDDMAKFDASLTKLRARLDKLLAEK